jgi:hypothetical protein
MDSETANGNKHESVDLFGFQPALYTGGPDANSSTQQLALLAPPHPVLIHDDDFLNA